MKLSKRSEYACLALVSLSRAWGGNSLTTADIAAQMDIPRKYLEQILVQLKGAGFVRSIRGAGGGFMLAKAPDQINLAEIIRLIDGALAPVLSASEHFYASTPSERHEPLRRLFREIRDTISDRLEHTTFADLIRE